MERASIPLPEERENTRTYTQDSAMTCRGTRFNIRNSITPLDPRDPDWPHFLATRRHRNHRRGTEIPGGGRVEVGMSSPKSRTTGAGAVEAPSGATPRKETERTPASSFECLRAQGQTLIYRRKMVAPLSIFRSRTTTMNWRTRLFILALRWVW